MLSRMSKEQNSTGAIKRFQMRGLTQGALSRPPKAYVIEYAMEGARPSA